MREGMKSFSAGNQDREVKELALELLVIYRKADLRRDAADNKKNLRKRVEISQQNIVTGASGLLLPTDVPQLVLWIHPRSGSFQKMLRAQNSLRQAMKSTWLWKSRPQQTK